MNSPLRVGVMCLVLAASCRVVSQAQAAALQRAPFLQVAAPDSIVIRWRTDVPCASVVHFGINAGVLTNVISDPSFVTEHEMRLTGLTPATQFFYSIGSSTEELAAGADCNFVTFPETGQACPTRVWVIGDAGQAPELTQTAMRDAYYRYTGSRRTDVCLALGDNCLCWGTEEEYQTYFFNIFGRLFQQTAVWPAIGNHETWGGVASNGLIPYLNIFTLPTHGEAGGVASGREEYYSFDYGNIHFICLDSVTQSRATNGPMANWLRADLAETTNQWIIAYWHQPPYSCGSHYSDNIYENEIWEMRQNIVPILEAGSVDLVLCGHSHIYERSYLLHGHYGFSASLQPSMILDAGSGREGDTGPYVKPTSGPLARKGAVYVEVGCSASVDEQICRHPVMFVEELQVGSLVLDINGNRLDAVFLHETGTIRDSFTILKGEPEPLRLCGLVVDRGKTILRWKSIPGLAYRVERTDNMHTSGWQPVSDSITAVGYTTSWTNLTTSGPIYLFRVVQLPAEPFQGKPEIPKAAQGGSTDWTAPERSSMTAFDPRAPDRAPTRPDSKRPPAGSGTGEAVICNTTYWKRNIRPQLQHSAWRWRTASMHPGKVRWQATLRA